MKDHQVLESKWLPPIGPSYKVNVDRAMFEIKNEASVGVVIRDHEENFIAGLSKKFQFPFDAVDIEAKALVIGLVFAREIGIKDLVLESDSPLAPAFVAHMIYGG